MLKRQEENTEQLNVGFNPEINQITQLNKKMSFYDYKINYNHFLGSGAYGEVYGVIERPENEKGLVMCNQCDIFRYRGVS